VRAWGSLKGQQEPEGKAQQLVIQQQEQMNILKEKLAQKQGQVEIYKQQLVDFQQTLKGALDKANATREADAMNLALQQQQLDGKENELAAIRQQQVSQGTEAVQVKEMLEIYQQKLKEKMDALKVARSQVDEYKSQILDLKQAAQDQDTKINTTKQFFYALEKKYADRQMDLNAKGLSLTMMQAMIDGIRQENLDQVRKLEEQIRQKKATIAFLQERLQATQVQLKLVGVAGHKQELAYEGRLSAMTASLAMAQRELKEKDVILAGLRKDLEQDKRAFTEQHQAIEAVRQKIIADQHKKRDAPVKTAVKGPTMSEVKYQLKLFWVFSPLIPRLISHP